jgi:hypothetical protein
MTLEQRQEAVAEILFETQAQGIDLFDENASKEEILEWVKSKWHQIGDLVTSGAVR